MRLHPAISILVLGIFFAGAFKSDSIFPGKMMYDVAGNPINAHGGGVLQVGSTYYFYGEYKVLKGSTEVDGVSCYSSTDLVNWKFEGIVLKKDTETTSLLRLGCTLERPKVLYNKKNDQYVMWFHHELYGKGYDAALTGLATSDSPVGPFTYQRSLRPNAGVWPLNYPDSLKNRKFPEGALPKGRNREEVRAGFFLHRDFAGGQMARDMTLFQVGEKAYHIHSSENNQTLHISELNDDYTDFTGNYVRALPGAANEAPALFIHKDKIYIITSGCTGWAPNAARMAVADSMLGEWMPLGNPVKGTEEEMDNTFYSQSTFILPYGNGFIFMADRWKPDNLPASEYVWLPIQLDQGQPALVWKEKWSMDEVF